ncbi:MAG: hypothetical protein LBT18_05070 [Endomicrobium sp.]|nr:hypothetical protein [Endomicrobium sp.]
MKIEIKNCNNIDRAMVEITENRLNIKYAMNGTGKSTIGKAIALAGKQELNQLKPFKYIDSEEADKQPSVTLTDIQSVAIFNEEYINSFVFTADEIVKNSFDIFVKNPQYDMQIKEIESLLEEIKNTFRNSPELLKVIEDFKKLSESFGKPTKSGGFAKNSQFAKGFSNGNKLTNIPEELEIYAEFLQNKPVPWLQWQLSGKEFIEISNKCPYCAQDIAEKKATVLQVGDVYEPKSINFLNTIITVLKDLEKYFSDDTKNKLKEITNSAEGLSKEEDEYLMSIRRQIDILLNDKLIQLQNLNFYKLKDSNIDELEGVIKNLSIKLDMLGHLNSTETQAIVLKINTSISKIVEKISSLKSAVARQKSLIQTNILKYKNEINKFLSQAGYKYRVDIEFENEQYKMKLKHADLNSKSINVGTQHLSYGEKNAFALVLFMYQSIKTNESFIILDDPISSFDRNKKYAIIDMLFRGKDSFAEKTVLMLTHDFEPIIDMFTISNKFNHLPEVAFLEVNNGILEEKKIKKEDVKTFGEVCKNNIQNSQCNIIKIIYLRRYYEITNNKGMVYQLLSNLLHRRTTPKLNNPERDMMPKEIDNANVEIKKDISDFCYKSILNDLNDSVKMKEFYTNAQCNYEKLQIFRIMIDEESMRDKNDILQKFTNETFHIENEYIMQLNPRENELIPQFIIDSCNNDINGQGK